MRTKKMFNSFYGETCCTILINGKGMDGNGEMLNEAEYEYACKMAEFVAGKTNATYELDADQINLFPMYGDYCWKEDVNAAYKEFKSNN